MALTLILGPRRSGKSTVAERLVAASADDVVYLAPLTATDEELERRVAAHHRRRPGSWQTVETAALADALESAPRSAAVLLDSLGTWIAEVLWHAGALGGEGAGDAAGDPDPDGESECKWQEAERHLSAEMRRIPAIARTRTRDVVVVAEEAGWAPVPPAAGTRRWLDLLGDATQHLSANADRVLLVVAGRTVELA